MFQQVNFSPCVQPLELARPRQLNQKNQINPTEQSLPWKCLKVCQSWVKSFEIYQLPPVNICVYAFKASSRQLARCGRISFASGRVRDEFSLFLSSKLSFGHNLMSFILGDSVLGILKWYGCVEHQFMLGCQIHGKSFETNVILFSVSFQHSICPWLWKVEAGRSRILGDNGSTQLCLP
jgi:hypothetical protein